MKSSPIVFTCKNHAFNFVDSPGLADLCSEVSSMVRFSDGAVVLVDGCKGVEIQTRAVLRQGWFELPILCLVLSKRDRLILELKMEVCNCIKVLIDPF
uniref:Tr-type G domain-containing protein n=1 Tax=Physcomitrium patens TaxID=3218 RepID=A0A2K1JIH3_PHYPA|nr:hypothetical protein PHYPA_018746 [Physcomitrium patens]